MASSSPARQGTSDHRTNETLETVHESNTVTSTTPYEHTTEKAVGRSYHLNSSPPHDQSTKYSPNLRQKRSLSTFAAIPLQSNFFPRSTAQAYRDSSAQKLYARPFDEFVIGPSNTDTSSGTPIKTDGSTPTQTGKNP